MLSSRFPRCNNLRSPVKIFAAFLNVLYNMNDFDVDGFIKLDYLASSPEFRNRRRDASKLGGMKSIEESIDSKLRQKFSGLRNEPFGFRVFFTHELDDLARKGDVQRRLGRSGCS